MSDFNQEQNVTEVSKEEKTMGGLIPLLNLFGLAIGSILIWVLKKEEMPFVDRTGKEYMNFLISMLIYGTVTGLLCIILIGFLILPVLSIFAIVINIIATVKAFNGEDYRYPLCIRFFK